MPHNLPTRMMVLLSFLLCCNRQAVAADKPARKAFPKIAVMETAFQRRGDVESFADARKAGYRAIQMHSGQPAAITESPIPSQTGLAIGTDSSILKSWQEAAKKHDVQIISLCAGSLNKCQIWDRDREVAMRIAKQTIDACASLDARIMLFPFFGPSKFQTSNEAFNGIAAFFRELLPYAKAKNVVIGIEAPVTTKRVLELMEHLGYPPNLKVYYDTGNLFEKEDIYEIIRQHAKEHFCEIHIKAANSAIAGKGKISLERLASALDDAGYNHWLVYEANRNGREPTANRKQIEKLQSFRKRR